MLTEVSEKLKEHLIEILFEKGLLAVVLLIFTFQVGKLLERYKAKLIYNQTLSQGRIEAYSKIRTSISNFLNLKRDYEKILIKSHNGFLEPQEIEDCKARYLAGRDEIFSILSENMFYISDDVALKLGEFAVSDILTEENYFQKGPKPILEAPLYEVTKIMTKEIREGR
jgi:hypothetical protein